MEVIKVLRSKGFKNIFIGLSGDSEAEDMRLFKDAGADIILIKPIDAAVLARIFENIKLGVVERFS